MEEKFWELREAMDRAHDKLCANYTQSNKLRYMDARMKFQAFCTGVLEKLMDENPNVLKGLEAQ
jgi:hypothetical protein